MTGGWVVPEVDTTIAALSAPPTFSVVIPVYQGAHIVGEAIESVLTQTTAPHEVIVCDDGSTDDLDGALTVFGDRIIRLRQAHKGVAAGAESRIVPCDGGLRGGV